ncbi:MAG: hypothetical protein ACO3KY_02705 [Lysobacterales bacterium]|jgi:hypothetical protein
MRYLLITILLLVLPPVVANASEGALRVSIEGGAFNSKFKFFDASDGCPSYTDIPGAPDFLGGVLASGKGATKKLPKHMPVHVFLSRPRDMPGISSKGGAEEIRRRALEVTLTGDRAELVFTGFEDNIPTWTASGDVEVRPASACLGEDEDDAGDDEADTDIDSEIAEDEDTSEDSV